MRRTHKRTGALHAYANFAWTLAKACLPLILILFALISVNNKEDGVKPKVEFLLTAEWDDRNENNRGDDVDLWMMTPNKKIISFGSKEVELMHLDRDDVGFTDEIDIDGIKYRNKNHQELISIRKIIPGEYIVSIHLYGVVTGNNPGQTSINPTIGQDIGTPIPIKIKLIKMNPYVSTIFELTVLLTRFKEEIHIYKFILDDKGSVIDLTRKRPEPLVEPHGKGITVFNGG